jgi:LmbE family N-acetylglucosaminyl deacetylase
MTFEPENWESTKRILVILAHPDDPDFFCGATLSRWCKQGHEVHYCLLTKGQRGSQDPAIDPYELGEKRVKEQEAAAAALGVKTVEFLDYIDGEVVADLDTRKNVTRVIRRWQPQILVGCDPLNVFPFDSRINHPDHRAAGQVVVDAAFPAAGSPMYYPEMILNEGLKPCSVEEVWLSLTANGNVEIDVTDCFDDRLKALHCHRSQINMPFEEFDQNMRKRLVEEPATGRSVYIEHFRRIPLK